MGTLIGNNFAAQLLPLATSIGALVSPQVSKEPLNN